MEPLSPSVSGPEDFVMLQHNTVTQMCHPCSEVCFHKTKHDEPSSAKVTEQIGCLKDRGFIFYLERVGSSVKTEY